MDSKAAWYTALNAVHEYRTSWAEERPHEPASPIQAPAMIGIVIVSHSRQLAEGLCDLLREMQPGTRVCAAGGAPDGGLGTSAEMIHQALLELDHCDGVLVFVDLGSAVMSAEIAIEWLPEPRRARVLISDAPLVEGAILAAMNVGLDLSLAEIAASAQEARQFPKNLSRVPTEQ
jgi:dihydroxyacetone kinase phosphotransfer subunit